MATIGLGLAISLMIISIVLSFLAGFTTITALDYSYFRKLSLKYKFFAYILLDMIVVLIMVSLIGTI